MKVALTGATGFIGSHILTELEDHGHAVTAFVRDDAQADAVTARGAAASAMAARGVAVRATARIARRARRPLIEVLLRPRVVVEVRQGHAREPRGNRLLDAAQIAFLFLRHEGVGRAGRFRPRGAADPVDVVLGHVRHVEIHDVSERGDVDAARSNIGRH